MEKKWNGNGSAIVKSVSFEESARTGRSFLLVDLYVESEVHKGDLMGAVSMDYRALFKFREFLNAAGFVGRGDCSGVLDYASWDGILFSGKLNKVLSGRVIGVYVDFIEYEGVSYPHIRGFVPNGSVYEPYDDYKIIVPEWWSKEAK